MDGANCTSGTNAYSYGTSSDLQSYTLSTCVNNSPQTSQNVSYIADPNQVQPCGAYVINYEGKTYRTVQIGTQCWMKDNLNVGIRVDNSNPNACTQDDANNGIIQKYCKSNLESNCDTYGALYCWHTVMAFASTSDQVATPTGVNTPHRGICPPGWHVPTDAELGTLETYATNPGQACDQSRNSAPPAASCLGAGTRLLSGGSLGFDMQLAGTIGYDAAAQGTYGELQSVTTSAYPSSYFRQFTNASSTIGRQTWWGHSWRYNGKSLRCIKN